MKLNRQIPQFNIQKVTDFGSVEAFNARIPIGLSDLLNGMNIDQKTNSDIRDMIFDVFQELSSAFLALRDIREVENGIKPKLIFNLRKSYIDLVDYCWKAYKDRMPKILEKIDINIGFLFKDEKNFEKEKSAFIEKYPDIGVEFIKMVDGDRKSWQNLVSIIRNNFSQHKIIEDKIAEKYFNLNNAELIFDNCWQAIEDIVAMCFSTKLFKGVTFVEIPENERDMSCPKRFVLGIKKDV